MSRVIIDAGIIEHNVKTLGKLFTDHNIHWTAVTKVLCGHKPTLKLLIDLGLRSFADSRLANLKAIRKLCPEAETMYLRPIRPGFASEVVKWANISVNTELEAIKALSNAALEQKKKHGVIIMIELGELREGIMPDHLIEFYREVFDLKGVEILGVGTNMACMYGVLPTFDKLMQLALYKRLIELTYETKLRWCSGGSSVAIPNILDRQLPKAINHFRVGESLFLGTDIINGGVLPGMKPDAFKLGVQIVELKDKPAGPMGEMGANAFGDKGAGSVTGEWGHGGERIERALLNVGRLDVPFEHLTPIGEGVQVVGGASDLLAAEFIKTDKNYKLGDEVCFKLDYPALLALMHSRYVEKEIVS